MTQLLAGYGEDTLTPPLGIELSGFGYYRNRRAETILDDLHVRVLALEQGETRALLISCDLLSFAVATADILRASISAATGIPADHILLACTHTHTGPATHALPGIGEIDPVYLAGVPGRLLAAVARALADLQPAELRYRLEMVEPIGFNRRTRTFAPIDPVLGMAVFTRAQEKIYLFTYACHPVTLGAGTAVSADWPGALARAVARAGHHAVVLQGFSGDINPAFALEHWGAPGLEEILLHYGETLYRRALLAERSAAPVNGPLMAVERRIRLPLAVPTPEEIRQRPTGNGSVSVTPPFVTAWAREAQARCATARAHPFVDDAPLTAIALGELAVLGLPGEVFCGYAHRLRHGRASILTVGLANGNVGYLPTADAYRTPTDYASYVAPMFYGALFPFAPAIEELLIREAESALAACTPDAVLPV